MDKQSLETLLNKVAAGHLTPAQAILELKEAPFKDLGFAKIDTHRALRQGSAEIIYGAGKTAAQIAEIAAAMQSAGQTGILVTRLDAGKAAKLKQTLPLAYNETGSIGIIGAAKKTDGLGKIVIATGGTSDMAVAEEAALTAEFLGNEVVRLYDVGVAGLHRLLANLPDIMEASVIITIAGMEGALTSVVAGLADCPVIGVPTSVGYGACFHGLSALLSMLNACASGVSIVNIDNGFGAAYQASMINHMQKKPAVKI